MLIPVPHSHTQRQGGKMAVIASQVCVFVCLCCFDALTCTNGDTPMDSLSSKAFMMLHFIEERERKSCNPTHSLPSAHLASCCVKWVCLSHCWIQKGRKTVKGSSSPNLTLERCSGKGFEGYRGFVHSRSMTSV